MNSYEERFAGLFGPDYYTFCFWKGRAALYAILRALDIKENDEVIVPGYTCVVVPNAVRYTGAKPVYADIAPGQYNLDPSSVEERITPNTRAVIVQHTYGIPADIESLRRVAEKYAISLIEDCAHVLVGSSYQGRLLGSFGTAAFFSSQWSKPYTTGLGGSVVTQDKDVAIRIMKIQATFQDPPPLRKLQLQLQYNLYQRFFKPEIYWFSQKALHTLSELGIFVGSSNSTELTGREPADVRWRMSEFQQRVGLRQLELVDENYAHRKILAQSYLEHLRQSGWPSSDHWNTEDVTLLRFPLQVANKTGLLKESRRKRVELGTWFDSPLHPLPLHEHQLIGYTLGSCPVAERAARNVINLPLHSYLTHREAKRVIQFVLSHASPVSADSEAIRMTSVPQSDHSWS